MNNPQAKKRIGFLFGAGISIPAGLPKTQTITNQILSGHNIMHQAGNYYIDEPADQRRSIPDKHVSEIVDFLDITKKEIDPYCPNKLNANYEDLYFMVSQWFPRYMLA